MGGLDRAGNPLVILRIHPQEVGPPCHDEVALRLEGTDMLGDQQRGLQQLPQLPVGEGGDRVVPIGIFIPEVACVVTGPSHIQCVGKGLEVRGPVIHQDHVVPGPLPQSADQGRLHFSVTVEPAVVLEGPVAHGPALEQEVGERLVAVQHPCVVSVVGTGIGGDPVPEAAQHGGYRLAALLPGQVPEADVHRPLAHVVHVAQPAVPVAEELLSPVRVPPRQVAHQLDRLLEGVALSAPLGHILPPGAVLTLDDDGVSLHGEAAPLQIAHMVVGVFERRPHILQLIGQIQYLHFFDDRHPVPSFLRHF